VSNSSIMCASLSCRTIIKEDDVRVKIGPYTYCVACAGKKEAQKEVKS
jgi:hypothetical protein